MLGSAIQQAGSFHLTTLEVGVVSALAATAAAIFSGLTFFRNRVQCDWRLTYREQDCYVLTVTKRDAFDVVVKSDPLDGFQRGPAAIPHFRADDEERYLLHPDEPVTILVSWKRHKWSWTRRERKLVPPPR